MSKTVNRETIQRALKPKFERAYRELFEELDLEYNSDNIRRAVRAGAHEIAKACLENGANAAEYSYVMTAAVAKEASHESLGQACVLVSGPQTPLPTPPGANFEGSVETEITEYLDNTATMRMWEGSSRHLANGNARVKSNVAIFPFVVEVDGKRLIPPGNKLYDSLNSQLSRVGGHPFEVTKVLNETEFEVSFRAGY